MICIGVDVGCNGGIALLDKEHNLQVWKIPATEHDISDLFAMIAEKGEYSALFAMIESVHAFKGQGVSSTFTFGRNYGFLRGMLIAHKISFIGITPQKWQKFFGLSSKGETKTAHKNRLKSKAQCLFPHQKITLATSDAILIAEYCYQIAK